MTPAMELSAAQRRANQVRREIMFLVCDQVKPYGNNEEIIGALLERIDALSASLAAVIDAGDSSIDHSAYYDALVQLGRRDG